MSNSFVNLTSCNVVDVVEFVAAFDFVELVVVIDVAALYLLFMKRAVMSSLEAEEEIRGSIALKLSSC